MLAVQLWFSETISAARSWCCWCLGSRTSLLCLRAALKGPKVTRSISNDLQGTLMSGCGMQMTQPDTPQDVLVTIHLYIVSQHICETALTQG